jgi:hypothetical protein
MATWSFKSNASMGIDFLTCTWEEWVAVGLSLGGGQASVVGNSLFSTLMQSLMEKGKTSPIIKKIMMRSSLLYDAGIS